MQSGGIEQRLGRSGWYVRKGITGTPEITSRCNCESDTFRGLSFSTHLRGRNTKDNGTQRLLGVPSVVDRLLQQAAHQVISLKFEPEFNAHSYGFRPGRNAHPAVEQAQKNIHEGYDYIVDIDLKNFFDEGDAHVLRKSISTI